MRTLDGNFHAAFCYDDDDLLMNQMAHPIHGSVYFNAGRTNGFTFWESTLVATLGSLAWEYGFENTAPSRNDMLNTVLGGSVLGEASSGSPAPSSTTPLPGRPASSGSWLAASSTRSAASTGS